MKKCSTSLSIWEIQIKTTMRYHLTPVWMAKINKSGNDRCWQGCGERGVLLPCWWECKLVQTLWKTVWRFLKKLKIELSYDPATAPLCIYQGYKHSNSKGHVHPNVYSSNVHNSQAMERAQMSINRWMSKDVVCIYTVVYLLSHQKEWSLAICNDMWMELEGIMLSEVSQRKTNTIWFHSCGI